MISFICIHKACIPAFFCVEYTLTVYILYFHWIFLFLNSRIRSEIDWLCLKIRLLSKRKSFTPTYCIPCSSRHGLI